MSLRIQNKHVGAEVVKLAYTYILHAIILFYAYRFCLNVLNTYFVFLHPLHPTISVSIDGFKPVEAVGKSKQEAEKKAAEKMLKIISNE